MKETAERLIEAAEQVLREIGLSHFSTREVARKAGVADGALYHHFANKNELLLAVIARHGSQYFDAIRDLPLKVGQRTLRENLEEVTWAIYGFQRKALPITCSLFADTKLLAQHRHLVHPKGGPDRLYKSLIGYLSAEQRLGRVAQEADLEMATVLLVGGCFQIAWVETHWGQKLSQAEARRRTEGVVQALLTGLAA